MLAILLRALLVESRFQMSDDDKGQHNKSFELYVQGGSTGVGLDSTFEMSRPKAV
jgi:hypothetical protein